MASFTFKMSGKNTTRSISLPSGPHPGALKIDDEINRLRPWEVASVSASRPASSGSVSAGLRGLDDLYSALDDFLELPSTQQELISHSFIDEALNGSVQLLDVCGSMREILVRTRENIQVLRSTLRRRRGDMSTENEIADYADSRKRMKRDVRKLIAGLKRMENRFRSGAPSTLHRQDHQAVSVLSEVTLISISIFQSLIHFLAPKSNKWTKWSVISKLVHRGMITCDKEQDEVNELELVDSTVLDMLSGGFDPKKKQTSGNLLESVEESIEGLEEAVGRLYRHLIGTRAFLLNILSQ